jgi:hypothetical protein
VYFPINNKSYVDVYTELILKSITSVSIKSSNFGTTAYLRLEWFDERLKWDPEKFSNITDCVINSNKIWLPDIQVYNYYQIKQDDN